ncbi:MAG: hypothetical protein H6821_02895 [Planctomycetaceae bacterium]|nr:hypothetical protein [Planctomycetaceae bacterium]
MTITAVVATVLTIPLVAWAGDEPFFGDFNLTDALVMFVGGGIGTIFWSLWAMSIVYAVFRRWWMPAALLLLLVALPVGYLNYFVCTGYLGDRQSWSQMQDQP